MNHEAIVVERGLRDGNMGRRLGAALWGMAGVSCVGLLLVVFVGENLILAYLGFSMLFLVGGVAALLTSGLLIARPTPGVLRWSAGLGALWLLVFGSMTLNALPDPDHDPLMSLSIIFGFGLAGALVTFWSGRMARLA